MLIVFDLDGTLVCARRRLYQLFSDLVGNEGIGYEAYWQAKFSQLKHSDILRQYLGYTPERCIRFEQQWLKRIENDHYLSMDTAVPGVHSCLESLSAQARLYVCTARQSSAQACEQLRSLGLHGYFEDILVTGQAQTKLQLLHQRLPVLGAGDWLVGDTGLDMQAGRELGVRTCAVLSGFCTRNYLMRYSPDQIVESVPYFKPWAERA